MEATILAARMDSTWYVPVTLKCDEVLGCSRPLVISCANQADTKIYVSVKRFYPLVVYRAEDSAMALNHALEATNWQVSSGVWYTLGDPST